MLDKMLKSDFLAKLAETEWVKKNITCRNITLRLDLYALKGTLTINFPPAPSDRIWYGFRTPPKLDIALRPCFSGDSLGKYEATLSTVMGHLEKRLKWALMTVLVLPNMCNAVLPFMDHIPYSVGAGFSSRKRSTATAATNIGPSNTKVETTPEDTTAATENKPPQVLSLSLIHI